MPDRGLDPSLVDVLERFGLITPEQADANLEAWNDDMLYYTDLNRRAREAYKQLPLRKRLVTDSIRWQRSWREGHDERGVQVRAAVRAGFLYTL